MADLRGTAGSVTYAGSDAPVVADIVLWTATFSKDRTLVTRPGMSIPRYSFGYTKGEGILRVVVTDSSGGANTSAPIPTGTRAALVLFEQTSPAMSYAFKASLFFMRKLGVDSANGSQQFAEYGWTMDGLDSNDTITVA